MKKRTLEEWSILLSGAARPVRMWVWMILITINVLYILFTGGKTDATGTLIVIIGAMFSDFVASTVTRSLEKKTEMKVAGAQKVVETATDSGNSTVIENINAGNETVNVNKKPPASEI